MRDGMWINYRTGKSFNIDEHERWLRRKGNADKLGVPKKVQDKFDEFEPVKDRNKFLLFVMNNSSVMRVRGHGNYVSFEFSSRRKRQVMEEIWLWGLKNAGAYTGMYIVNFATGEKTNVYWNEFKDAMDNDNMEKVLRLGTTKFKVKKEVAEELLKLSKSLIDED